MPRSKSKRSKSSRSKSRKNVIRKEGWMKPVNEDLSKLLDEDFDDGGIAYNRKYHRPTALVKTSMRDGRVIRDPTSKRVLAYGDEHVKKPTGKRDTTTLNHRRTRLTRLYNQEYRQPPKKKTCCERWFRWGSKKRNKKCKKKCKTRKKKRKKRTRKRKKRKKKKR